MPLVAGCATVPAWPRLPAERHAGARRALARLQDEAAADAEGPVTIVDQQPAPILVEAGLWFQDSELAGMPVVRIRGDSMGDTLRDGDFVLVDTDDTDVSQGGIFALLDDCGSLIIKQVQLVYESGNSTGRIRCTPRNPAYRPFVLPLEDVRIIGRVAHKITRHLSF